MKLLVLSDLHLAHLSFSGVHEGRRIDEEADIVVLAGDIDDGVGGFRWARETFPDKPVVYVAGIGSLLRSEAPLRLHFDPVHISRNNRSSKFGKFAGYSVLDQEGKEGWDSTRAIANDGRAGHSQSWTGSITPMLLSRRMGNPTKALPPTTSLSVL